MAHSPSRAWYAESPAAALADMPSPAGPRSRDPDDVARRIEERLEALRAANRARAVRQKHKRFTESQPWQISRADFPPRPVIKRNWQRRARLRLAAVAWDGPAPAEAPIEFSPQQLAQLGRRFLAAAEECSFPEVMIFLEEGFPVNYQDPATGDTALHIAAGNRARRVVAALLATGECDFLLRNRQGQLASELAFVDGADPALARLLGWKEQRQGAAQGVAVPRRFKQPADG